MNAPAPSAHTSALPVPLQEKCQYPSKSCPQRRALKVDGELHRLCEFHRQLANRNQQRLQQRRRLLRLEKEYANGGSPPRSPRSSTKPSPITKPQSPEALDCSFYQLDGLGELALEDLDILLQLLDNDEKDLLNL